jgi:hypothetical protein
MTTAPSGLAEPCPFLSDSHNNEGFAMRMSRTSTLLSGLALTATLTVAACHNERGAPIPTPHATVEGPPPTSAPPTAVTPNTYKAVKRPCDVVDFGPLEAVLGKATGDLLPEKSTSTGLISSMTCSRRLRSATGAATVLVQMDVFNRTSAEGQYHGLRKVRAQSMPITDVPGLGQSAYTRIDPDIGPHLTVYDGNLHLEIAVLGATALTAPTESSR